jgi:hypothetical protein
MAFSRLEKAMGTLIGLDLARPGTSRAAARQALRVVVGTGLTAGSITAAGTRAAGTGLARAAIAGGGAPIGLGVATGLGILNTPAGQELLEAAEQKGREDRVRAEQALTNLDIRTRPARRKVSKYQKAIKAGMAAVKKSKFGGKPGKITNAKITFGAVNKVASALNKGKKTGKAGLKGVASRAMSKILKFKPGRK